MAKGHIYTVLFFGSFNPIHNGHTAVAEYVMDSGLCDELWFVVSPQNPLKPTDMLAPDNDRLAMAGIAVRETMPGRKAAVCDVEFSMPKPSYTIDTLTALSAKHPGRRFMVLAGTDIFTNLRNWKESKKLTSGYRFLIYPREGYPVDDGFTNITYLSGAPTWDYSSTEVREALADGGEEARSMVSPGVFEYIRSHNLWTPDYEAMLKKLTDAIAKAPASAGPYLDRARLHYRNARYDKALNDFLKAEELEPGNAEAREYINLLKEIFEFRYMDYYNP